jgi:hypothetical protein
MCGYRGALLQFNGGEIFAEYVSSGANVVWQTSLQQSNVPSKKTSGLSRI